MIKKFTSLITTPAFLLWFHCNVQAQQSANTAGGDATGAGGSASYSLGQVDYTAVVGSNGKSNQGVQQPYEIFVCGINNVPGINLLLTAYPNPTQSVLYLKVENADVKDLSYQLYDVRGREILSAEASSNLNAINMQNLSTGTYMLRVTSGNTQIKSFTIIKNQ
jgi:hypothetical protein